MSDRALMFIKIICCIVVLVLLGAVIAMQKNDSAIDIQITWLQYGKEKDKILLSNEWKINKIIDQKNKTVNETNLTDNPNKKNESILDRKIGAFYNTYNIQIIDSSDNSVKESFYLSAFYLAIYPEGNELLDDAKWYESNKSFYEYIGDIFEKKEKFEL